MYTFPGSDEDTGKQKKWLEENFFTKFIKWVDSVDEKQPENALQSMGLINLEEYNELYNTLKIKYGQRMVEV